MYKHVFNRKPMFLKITLFWDVKLCIPLVGINLSKEPAVSFFKAAIPMGRTGHHDNLQSRTLF
jgi:hypothetical protein